VKVFFSVFNNYLGSAGPKRKMGPDYQPKNVGRLGEIGPQKIKEK